MNFNKKWFLISNIWLEINLKFLKSLNANICQLQCRWKADCWGCFGCVFVAEDLNLQWEGSTLPSNYWHSRRIFNYIISKHNLCEHTNIILETQLVNIFRSRFGSCSHQLLIGIRESWISNSTNSIVISNLSWVH